MNPYMALKPYEGQYLKYPQLCEIIGEEKRTGRGKMLHMKRIQQYVDCHQEKSKIYIGRVYTDEDDLQIIESHGKFTTYIRQYLIGLFYELERRTGDTSIVMTNRDILEGTCMVNQQYFHGKNAPYKYLDNFKLPINKQDVPNEQFAYNRLLDESELFFSSSYRLLKRVIYDSLTSLEHMSLIHKNKTFRLYKNYTDEHGKFQSIHHDCNEEEISRILTVQHDAIIEFNEETKELYGSNSKYNLPNIQCVHYLYPTERKRFYKIMNRRLCEEFKEEGWNAYSSAWKINLAQPQSFQYEIARMNYKQLNQNVQDKLMTAKDLQLIEKTLRKDFVDTYIKV